MSRRFLLGLAAECQGLGEDMMRWYKISGEAGWAAMIRTDGGKVMQVDGGPWCKALAELLLGRTIREMERLARERGLCIEECGHEGEGE